MNKIPYTLSLGIVLAVLWLLLSGHFTPLMLLLGLASVSLTVYLSVRMEVIDHEGHPVYMNIWAAITYWCWLLKAIVIANIDVIRRIWSPALPISPTVIRVSSTLSTDLLQVIYANSITLTPGTISINVDDNTIEVHALTREGADELEEGEMHNRIKRLENN